MTIKLLGELTVKIAHSLNSSSPSDTSQPRAALVLLIPAQRLLHTELVGWIWCLLPQKSGVGAALITSCT